MYRMHNLYTTIKSKISGFIIIESIRKGINIIHEQFDSKFLEKLFFFNEIQLRLSLAFLQLCSITKNIATEEMQR